MESIPMGQRNRKRDAPKQRE